MRALASTSRRLQRCRPARVVVATPSAPSRRGRAGDDRASSRSSARAVTRARRRVASAPTPRRAPTPGRPRHGAIVDFTFTRERPMRMGLRTTRIRIVDDAHATKTAIARSPRPRVGRRARVGRATRSRRHFTHRRSQWCARCDATRRAREDEDDRGRARETARGAPRRGSGRDDAGRGCRVIRRGRSSCLLYTSPSPRDRTRSRMPSSA